MIIVILLITLNRTPHRSYLHIHTHTHCIYTSAVKRLITSKIKVFVYKIYVCELCIFIMYIKYTHRVYIYFLYLHVYTFIFLYLILYINIIFIYKHYIFLKYIHAFVCIYIYIINIQSTHTYIM